MSASIDQQFIEYIVKSVVGNPEAVSIERRIDEKGVLLELTVDPEDLGRVIGKRGATAQSLRTLLRALGTKNDARYNLKIVDNGGPGARTHAPADDNGSSDDVTAKVDEPAAADDTTPVSSGSGFATKSTDDDIVATEEEGEDHSSAISQTRKELEELDDLDV